MRMIITAIQFAEAMRQASWLPLPHITPVRTIPASVPDRSADSARLSVLIARYDLQSFLARGFCPCRPEVLDVEVLREALRSALVNFEELW